MGINDSVSEILKVVNLKVEDCSPSTVEAIRTALAGLVPADDAESDALLNGDLGKGLAQLLRLPADSSLASATATAIAEMAKSDKVRDSLSGSGVTKLIATHIKPGHSRQATIQALRATANLAAGHDENRKALVESGALESIIAALKAASEEADPNEELAKNAAGALLNIVIDDEEQQKKAISLHAIKYLLIIAKAGARAGDSGKIVSPGAVMAGNVLMNLVDEPSGLQEFIKEGGLEALNDILKDPLPTRDLVQFAIEFLESLSLDDSVQVDMFRRGCFSRLWEFTQRTDVDLSDDAPIVIPAESVAPPSSEAQGAEGEAKKPKKLTFIEMRQASARTIALISQSDELINLLFESHEWTDRFRRWMHDSDVEFRMSGALCIGNIARRDDICIEFLKRGVVDDLKLLVNSEHVKEAHAALGALKHLAIPAVNKPVLVEKYDLFSTIFPVANASKAMVLQLPAASILRSLLSSDSNVQKAMEMNILDILLPLAKDGSDDSIKSEAIRAIVNLTRFLKGKAREELAKEDVVESLVWMLDSVHPSLRNEALIGLNLIADSFSQLRGKIACQKGFEYLRTILKAGSDDANRRPDAPGTKCNAIILIHRLLMQDDATPSQLFEASQREELISILKTLASGADQTHPTVASTAGAIISKIGSA